MTEDIFAAADSGDAAGVLAFVRKEPDLVKAKGLDGATALHFAATPDIARVLIEHGADIEAVDDFHRGTPLQWAVSKGRADVAEYLLNRGSEIDLWTACALDRIDKLNVFLSESPHLVSEQSSDRNTLRSAFKAYPLHFAARYGSINAIRLLIDHGASVKARSSDGSLPIHDAAFMGHLEAVKILIENGSPADDRDLTYHATPLGVAEYAGRSEVAAYLRSIGVVE